MKLNLYPFRVSRGFSALELLTILGILVILAAVVIGYFGNIHSITKGAKLENDLRMLNSAISGYINFGGDLGDGETTDTVIQKLKTKASRDTSKTVVGLSGSFLDSRLEVEMQTADEAASDMTRIYYDAASKKFVSATEGPIGIRKFSLGSEPSGEEEGTEDRTSIVSFASESTWVWDYGDAANPIPSEGPDLVSTTPIPVALAPSTAPVGAPENTLLLQQPVISHPTGDYPMAAFDLSVSLSNHNPPGSSSLTYSLDFGDWQDYTGPVTVSGGANIRAQVNPLTEKWRSSSLTVATYGMLPGVLDPPTIGLSATSFGESTPTVEVSINNPNGSGTSVPYYALRSPDGAYSPITSYTLYTGPFLVSEATFPEGFLVQTYAKSSNSAVWEDSGFVEAAVQASFFDIPLTGDRILFVIDASSSMNEEYCSTGLERYEVAVNELISSISALPNDKEFGIAMFDEGQHWIYNGASLQLANSVNKQAAITSVSTVDNDSGTNYDVGLAYPLQFSPRPDQVIFLSDGGPSSSTSWHDELAALVTAEIRVDCVGIECEESEKVHLEFIASETGGATRYLNCDDSGTQYSGFSEGVFGSLKGRSGSTPKSKLKNNNGHGNNYDGVDGSNPATIKGLLDLPDGATDDEIKAKMPKNSTYLESGDGVTTTTLPNGALFSGAAFSFTTAGDNFTIGNFSYYNGDAIETSEVSEMLMILTVKFESPTLTHISLPIRILLTNSTNKGDILELAQPIGGSWPNVTLDSVSYQLVPTFALTTADRKGKMSRAVAIGKTGVYQIQAKLIPNL